MRLWAWLASPATRLSVLQALVLLVLVANVAVSRPFREFWRQLREVHTVREAEVEEGGATDVHLTLPQDSMEPEDVRFPTEVCLTCDETCLNRALPVPAARLVEPPARLPRIHQHDVTPELSALLSEPVVNPYTCGYLHNPRDLCNDGDVEIIFFVSTRPEDVYRRREIRRDQLGLFKAIAMFRNVEALFIMGMPSTDDYMGSLTQTLIDMEAKKYRDIIQVNFTDTAANLHLKAVSILRWAPSYCRSLKYVIHTADDVTMETRVIYSLRYIGKRHENFVLGRIERRLAVSSYPMLNDSFPNDYFPPFARHGLIGYPANTARMLFEASLRVKPISRHDVYVTGMCADKVGAELLEDRRFRCDVITDDEASGELF